MKGMINLTMVGSQKKKKEERKKERIKALNKLYS